MANRIDHVVVGADTLSHGAAVLERVLGVALQPSYKHPEMSTHNSLMQVGGEHYFELIAIDPDAPDPGRSRWFSLDDSATQRRLSERPRALTWVVGTDDLDATLAGSPIEFAHVVDFRRGDRTWRLTVPQEGSLIMGGLVPALIEWSPGPHVSGTLPDLGVRLEAVRLKHPEPERLRDMLRALQVDHLAQISEGPAGLSFAMKTPAGEAILD